MGKTTIFTQDEHLHISYYVFDEEKQKEVRKKKSTGLKDTKTNRELIESKIIKDLNRKIENNEIIIKKKVYTFERLANEWIVNKQIDEKRKYTIKTYRGYINNHLMQYFKDMNIYEICEDDINAWQAKMLKNFEAKTVSNVKGGLSQIFKLAKDKRLITINPVEGSKKLDTDKVSKHKLKVRELLLSLPEVGISEAFNVFSIDKQDPFTEEEIEIMIKNADYNLKNFIALSYFLAGMRPSEMLALKWDRIDFKERIAVVLGAHTGKEDEEERDLNKSIAAVRRIILGDNAMKFLQEQFKKTGLNKQGYVFLNQYQNPFKDSRSLNRQFNNLLEYLNIRKRRLYNLRHSYASINLSENRLPLLFVSDQMGHADAQITLKVYSKFIRSSEIATIDMVNKASSSFKF